MGMKIMEGWIKKHGIHPFFPMSDSSIFTASKALGVII